MGEAGFAAVLSCRKMRGVVFARAWLIESHGVGRMDFARPLAGQDAVAIAQAAVEQRPRTLTLGEAVVHESHEKTRKTRNKSVRFSD